jgi:hypothetical protein
MPSQIMKSKPVGLLQTPLSDKAVQHQANLLVLMRETTKKCGVRYDNR